MYSLIVFLHVAAGFAFMLAHGASASAAFALRRERRLERVQALLDLSGSMQQALGISLLVLLAAGVVAGFMGQWWGYGWIWTALALLILMSVYMFFAGTTYYAGVRKAAGLEYMERGKPQPAQPPVGAAELDRLLAASPAVPLAVVGSLGWALILALMMFKPF